MGELDRKKIELTIRRMAREVAAKATQTAADAIGRVLDGDRGDWNAHSTDPLGHLWQTLQPCPQTMLTHAITNFAEDLRNGRLGDRARDDAERWWELAEAIGSDRASNRRAYQELVAGNKDAAMRVQHRVLRSLRALENTEGASLTFAQQVGTVQLGAEVALQLGHGEMAARTLKLLPEGDLVSSDPDKLNRLAELALQHAQQAKADATDARSGFVRVIHGFVNDEREKHTLKRLLPLSSPLGLARWPRTMDWAETLRGTFPWMHEAIDAIAGQAAMQINMGQPYVAFKPILLVGSAGTGKTALARTIAGSLGVPAEFINFAGSADNMALKGASRGWGTSRPSFLIEAIAKHRVPNLIVQADEVDKIATETRNGNAAHTLLSLLEKTSAARMLDEYLLGEVDLSRLNWIATANDISQMPSTLRSRFQIVHVEGPRAEHFDIVLKTILREIAGEYSVRIELLPHLDAELIDVMRAAFRRSRNMRVLARAVGTALIAAANQRPALLN